MTQENNIQEINKSILSGKTVTAISLYPWLIIVVLMMGSSGSAGSAYGSGLMILLVFMILSGLNLIVSLIAFFVASYSSVPLAKSSPCSFLAMNSISVLWLMPLFINV